MEFRTREQWGAEYDVSNRALMKGLPVDTVFVHHTVTNVTDDPNADMQQIEAIDMQRFGVPSYSEVFHPSGVVLEGMGIHRGAHTIDNQNNSFNDVSFGFSFIGNYMNISPTVEQIKSFRLRINQWIETGYLKPIFILKGHRDVYATACCGDNLYNILPALYPTSTTGDNDLGTLEGPQAVSLARIEAMMDANRWNYAAIQNLAHAAGQPVNIDEIVMQVLAGLSPEKIASLIDTSLAQDVIAALKEAL